jgi:hypothetical protein
VDGRDKPGHDAVFSNRSDCSTDSQRDKRRPEQPERFAKLQIARLTKALRPADAGLDRGELKAIGPFLKVVAELDRYHDLPTWPMRSSGPAQLGDRPGATALKSCVTASPGCHNMNLILSLSKDDPVSGGVRARWSVLRQAQDEGRKGRLAVTKAPWGAVSL